MPSPRATVMGVSFAISPISAAGLPEPAGEPETLSSSLVAFGGDPKVGGSAARGRTGHRRDGRRRFGGERRADVSRPGGLWRNYRPEESTPEAFARDPNLVWECTRGGGTSSRARPNRARGARGMEPAVPALHARDAERRRPPRARRDRERRSFHGSLWEPRASPLCRLAAGVAARRAFDELPPRCPSCGDWRGPASSGSARASPEALSRARTALTATCIVVGTSAVVSGGGAGGGGRGARRVDRGDQSRGHAGLGGRRSALACPAEQAQDVERLLSEGDPPRRSGLS
jgi:hypothetical protein